MTDTEVDAPVSLVDRVYAELREAIVDGRREAGTPLRLHELTSEFGVSLIPVREAIRKLEVERLVEMTPNKGARVAELTVEDLYDSYRVRASLEAQALRLAFPKLSPEDIVEAREIVDSMVQAYDHDPRLSAELHRELHFLIYDRAESEWLGYLIRLLWAHTERYRRLGTPVPSGGDLGGEHLRMLDALADGRIEAAVEALQTDLEDTADRAMVRFTRQQSQDAAG
ncbi:MAG: GntR family transcriptional regulator [Acidobacteria bacterium]|nr:GntR family transcriptional regulator [Acidobacteriota bacterium]MCH8990470.1 GntR family transcriptional regulator [Acidobacteriota bacterium]